MPCRSSDLSLMKIPTLTTARLILRPFAAEDAGPLHRILAQDQILRYFPRPDPPDRARVERLIDGQLQHWEEHGLGWWAVELAGSGELLGWCGLQHLPETGEVEVGYLLSQRHWGQGLATEAARASLRWGFETHGLRSIVGIVHPENAASRRVLEKAGLVFINEAEYFGMAVCRYVIAPDRWGDYEISTDPAKLDLEFIQTEMTGKSSVEQIRARFDNDVERFSSLETGQSSTMDAPISLELIAACAAAVTPRATRVLDIGCGAGNYTLKLLGRLPDLHVTLLDLSRPMLDRGVERVAAATRGQVVALQGDIREVELGESAFDVIMAAAVFHHLRDDAEWEAVFAKCHRGLAPGGGLWISDLVAHEDPRVQAVMWARYGAYLEALHGPAYRDHVFGYIEQEDTPRSLTYQLELLARVGFVRVDVLHKNACFAAFGGVKAAT